MLRIMLDTAPHDPSSLPNPKRPKFLGNHLTLLGKFVFLVLKYGFYSNYFQIHLKLRKQQLVRIATHFANQAHMLVVNILQHRRVLKHLNMNR
jgi:hypothetical protein